MNVSRVNGGKGSIPGGSMVKSPPANVGDMGPICCGETNPVGHSY